jgi:5-methylcytosine-specific restriction endonuclease McrA
VLSNAAPKPEPRFSRKQRERAAEAKQLKSAHAAINARDGHKCRVCKVAVTAVGVATRVHHHHLVYRSRGGTHETKNVLSLCPACHHAVHAAEIRLSGDADLRSPHTGALCGVVLERYTEGGWRKERVL